MARIHNVLRGTGFFVMMGGAGLDSEPMAVPAGICLAGLLLMCVGCDTRSRTKRSPLSGNSGGEKVNEHKNIIT